MFTLSMSMCANGNDSTPSARSIWRVFITIFFLQKKVFKAFFLKGFQGFSTYFENFIFQGVVQGQFRNPTRSKLK